MWVGNYVETLGLFAAAGVRIVPIEDFEPRVAWFASQRLLLIDAHLTTEERRRVARHYLPVVLAGQVRS